MGEEAELSSGGGAAEPRSKLTDLSQTAPQREAAVAGATPHSLHVCVVVHHALRRLLGAEAEGDGSSQPLQPGAPDPGPQASYLRTRPQASYLRTRSSWSLGVLPEDDGLGGNRQLLADLLRQRLVGGPTWDHDGEGEAEPDFDDAGVVGELEFKVRGQRRCTLTCRFDEAVEQVSPSAARLCRPHGDSDLGHL